MHISSHQAVFSTLPSLPIGRRHAFLPRPHLIRIPVSKAAPAGLPHLHSLCYSLQTHFAFSLAPVSCFHSFLKEVLLTSVRTHSLCARQLKSGEEVCKAHPRAAFPEHGTLEDRFQRYFPLSPRKSLLSRMLNLPYREVKISQHSIAILITTHVHLNVNPMCIHIITLP